MSTSLTRTYSLPHGYRATFTWPAGQSMVMWAPAVPRIHKARQRRRFLDAYRAVRREFLTEVAATIGGNVLVVDTDEHLTRETILAPTRH